MPLILIIVVRGGDTQDTPPPKKKIAVFLKRVQKVTESGKTQGFLGLKNPSAQLVNTYSKQIHLFGKYIKLGPAKNKITGTDNNKVKRSSGGE